jgi:hypothetical protein
MAEFSAVETQSNLYKDHVNSHLVKSLDVLRVTVQYLRRIGSELLTTARLVLNAI